MFYFLHFIQWETDKHLRVKTTRLRVMLVIATKSESSSDTRFCLCHTDTTLSRLFSKSWVVTRSITSCKFSVIKSIDSIKKGLHSFRIAKLAIWSKTLSPANRKSAKLKINYTKRCLVIFLFLFFFLFWFILRFFFFLFYNIGLRFWRCWVVQAFDCFN